MNNNEIKLRNRFLDFNKLKDFSRYRKKTEEKKTHTAIKGQKKKKATTEKEERQAVKGTNALTRQSE